MLGAGVIAGKSLDLSLELLPTSAESLRALWPELMLAAPLSGSLRLAGDLPHVDMHFEGALGPGKLRAHGPVELGAKPTARLELSARDVDLAAVSREWPKSRINLDAEVGVRRVRPRAVVSRSRGTPLCTFSQAR